MKASKPDEIAILSVSERWIHWLIISSIKQTCYDLIAAHWWHAKSWHWRHSHSSHGWWSKTSSHSWSPHAWHGGCRQGERQQLSIHVLQQNAFESVRRSLNPWKLLPAGVENDFQEKRVVLSTLEVFIPVVQSRPSLPSLQLLLQFEPQSCP